MLKIAEMRGDVMGRAQNALYLGDMRELVRRVEGGFRRGWWGGPRVGAENSDARRLAPAQMLCSWPPNPHPALLLT
jgi:hypothetical protein